jgi:hypothetical protein
MLSVGKNTKFWFIFISDVTAEFDCVKFNMNIGMYMQLDIYIGRYMKSDSTKFDNMKSDSTKIKSMKFDTVFFE